MNDLTKLKQYSHNKLDEQFEELQTLLDKHEDISKFFELLTLQFSIEERYSKKARENVHLVASDVLSTFVYNIWKIDISSDLLNTFHFNGGWVPNIISFMVNVFLDDSGFSIKQNRNGWEVSQGEDDNWYQDPNILIAAAYDTAKFYIEVETVPNGPPKLEIMKRGMISSGEVEKLLKQYE